MTLLLQELVEVLSCQVTGILLCHQLIQVSHLVQPSDDDFLPNSPEAVQLPGGTSILLYL